MIKSIKREHTARAVCDFYLSHSLRSGDCSCFVMCTLKFIHLDLFEVKYFMARVALRYIRGEKYSQNIQREKIC